MAKYLLIAAVVLSLATAGIGFVNQSKLAQTRSDLEGTQKTLATSTSENTKLKTELTSTKTALETASSAEKERAAAITALQSELDTVKGQVTAANNAASEKDASIQSLTAENDELKRKIAQGPSPEAAPAAPIDDPQKRELEALVTTQQDKIKGLEAQLASLNKREQDRSKGLMQPGLEGRILAVNPAWNFVVLSIGDKQGVVNNAEMLIKRGGQYLGKVRVTSVEPATSIADIVANTLPAGVAVQPGDSVIYQQSRN